MNTRVDRILTKLALHYAQNVFQNPSIHTNRTRTLANALARNGILVMMGILPPNPQEGTDVHISAWVSLYSGFYDLLAETIFPSFAHFNAVYGDDQYPPLVVLRGAPDPIMRVLGGYVAPYVALRQHNTHITEAEMRGIMLMLLEDLEAHDLHWTQSNYIIARGKQLLHSLIQMPLQQVAFTDFTRPMFEQVGGGLSHQPNSVNGNGYSASGRSGNASAPLAYPVEPPQPPAMPEPPTRTPTGDLFTSQVPLPIQPARGPGDTTGPLPPLPRLPKQG